jgi:hypothetical protein
MTIITKVRRTRPDAQRRRDAPTLPRRTRIGSMLASATVGTALLGSVVIGLTSMADEELATARRAVATQPA